MKRLKEFAVNYGFMLHPLLFAIFPLLSFYGANASEIQAGDFRLSSFFVFNLIVGVVAWLVSWLLTFNIRKASILTLVLLIIFFTFGRIHNHMQGVAIKTPFTLLGPTKILFVISLIIVGLAWLILRRFSEETTNKANKLLLIVGAFLVVSSLFTVIPGALKGSKSAHQNQDSQTTVDTSNTNQEKPDVYYIILDGYARSDILKDKFGYDNTEFLNGMKSKGFYVAEQANSNYAHTHFSLPSTFNMKYLNYLTDQMGKESTDRAPLKELLHRDNEVVKTFKSLGYKFANIGTQWGWGKTNPLADDLSIQAKTETESKVLNIKLDEFAQVYLQTTAVKPWVSTSIRSNLVGETLQAFDKTAEVAKLPESTLTVTHIVSPHPPYLFNREGIIPGLTKLELDNDGFSDRKAFADQTVYINKLVLEMVDKILQNSNKPPIIVVASDHGPASGLKLSDIAQTDPTKFNVDGIKERMANLNTYYFPDKNYEKLYPNITPVNTFRIILNQYFGQNLELLPDRSYFSNNKANEYFMHDVTELIK